jgi:hypothetical protein
MSTNHREVLPLFDWLHDQPLEEVPWFRRDAEFYLASPARRQEILVHLHESLGEVGDWMGDRLIESNPPL